MTPDGTAYDLTGPDDAPVVVLIHGLGLTRAVWQWLVPDLSRYRVLAYDLLGHGQSAAPDNPPEEGPHLQDLSAQLVRLLDHHGIGQAALVGFSLGGMVARRFAQDHPARVTALVLLHTPYRRSPAAQAAVEARVTEAAAHGPGATVDAALARWYTDAAPADLVDLTRRWVLANDARVYPRLYRILATGVEELCAPSPPITCPTLVLTSDQDHGNGPGMATAIALEIPRARLVILPGLRHMALAEDPPAVNRPVRAFLDETLR